MDTKLARVMYTLNVAAKLKKNNPELCEEFIKKNDTYFPNETDRQFDKDLSKAVASKVKSSGFSDPKLNIRSTGSKQTAKNSNENSNDNFVPKYVPLNHETEVKKNMVFKMPKKS